ncbi:MAG: hemerythrin domain-containing protein, partial [Gammaproteobacteria bacterium]
MALNPIDRLQRDHANMGRVLALIRLQLDLLALNAKLDLTLLANSAYYMRKYPSVVHHPKEDLVFEKLLELGGPARAEIERLESEHQELYRLEDQLIELTLAIQAGKIRTRAQLLQTGRFYLLTQAQHMRTEERVVFPAALRRFKARDWRAIEA